MKVTLLESISGTPSGRKGDVIDLPDVQALRFISAGIVEKVPVDPLVAQMAQLRSETADLRTRLERRELQLDTILAEQSQVEDDDDEDDTQPPAKPVRGKKL